MATFQVEETFKWQLSLDLAERAQAEAKTPQKEQEALMIWKTETFQQEQENDPFKDLVAKQMNTLAWFMVQA